MQSPEAAAVSTCANTSLGTFVVMYEIDTDPRMEPPCVPTRAHVPDGADEPKHWHECGCDRCMAPGSGDKASASPLDGLNAVPKGRILGAVARTKRP